MLWVGPLCAVAVDAGAGYVWCKLPSHYVLSPVIDKSCHAGPAQHTPHKTLGSPAWDGNYWEQPESSLGGERREKACHKHWDRLSVSIQECIQSRSSDADLGWLWAPPMNLSCMAIKIKANKERFGWEMPDLDLSPRRVHHWPVNSLAPSDDREPGTLQSFQWPLIKSDIFTPLQITRQPRGHWPSRALLGNLGQNTKCLWIQWMWHLTVSLSW